MVKIKRKPVTAAELIERLSKDPDYAERVDKLANAQAHASAEIRRELTPVIEDLRSAGCSVLDLNELRTSAIVCGERAASILIKWLPRVERPQAKEIIVRALSVPAARPSAAPILIQEFRRARPSQLLLKWAIGNALSVVADDSVAEDVIELAQQKEHGKGREMIVEALGNLKDPRAVETAIRLLDEEEVAGHAITALGNLRAKGARRAVQKYLHHGKQWIRTEARKALHKIDHG
jgi:hypothetical protein